MRTDCLYRVLRGALVFLTGFLLTSCEGLIPGENNQEKEPEITVDISSLDVFTSGITVEASPSGGVFNRDVLFITTDQWAATVSGIQPLDWITIQPASGAAGIVSMKVSVVKNESESERTAEITITCGTAKKSFMVKQDGNTEQKPPVTETPAVHNYSDPSSGATVISYDYHDGTLILDVDEDKIPKVGDIVCSGVTEQAPYGYLFQVGSVEEITSTKGFHTRIMVIGTSLSLYAVCELLGISSAEWYTLHEVSTDVTCTDDGGHSIVPVKDGDDNVVPFNLTFKPSDKVTISFDFVFGVSSLRLYLDTTTPNIVVGFDAKTRATFSSHLTLEKEIKKSGDVFKEMALLDPTIIKVYEFDVGIPIVISTKYKPTAPYNLSLSGKVDMDLFNKTYYPHMAGIWHTISNKFEPVEGTPGHLYMEDGGDVSLDYPSQDLSVTLNGTASFGIDFEFSLGLYGGNIFDESIEAIQEAFALDSSTKISAKYLSIGVNGGLSIKNEATLGAMTNLAEYSHNMVRVIDDNKFSSYFYGKIWGVLFKWERHKEEKDDDGNKEKKDGVSLSVLSGEKEVKFLKSEFHFPYFFPSYSKLKINSITRQDFINISGRRHKPLFRFFKESDYGFCLESADRKDYYTFDATSIPINSDNHILSFDVPFPTAKLRRNVKYSIYPYSTITNFPFIGERKVCREGVSFAISDDGQLTTSVIDDVPGEVL